MFAGSQLSLLRGLAATAALLFSLAKAAAQDAPIPVESIDMYGSDAFDFAAIRAELEPDILKYVAAGETARTNPKANYAELEATALAAQAKIAAALGARVPLAHVSISVTTGFTPSPHINVTIDVVEKADQARRMPFREAPTGKFDDPDGLLAAWNDYVSKVFELAYAGMPLQALADECPALHCIAPFERPELAPYLARFNDGARKHEDLLYTIAAESGDESQRANALFLLAHTTNTARLLPVLGQGIYDPVGGVRNNAMRVLMYMAQAHPELDYPIDDLILALDFPDSGDRNKASYTILALAANPKYHETVRAKAVPVALRLLRLEQPNNHEPAYEILKTVSGEKFGDRDYAAWERWAANQ